MNLVIQCSWILRINLPIIFTNKFRCLDIFEGTILLTNCNKDILPGDSWPYTQTTGTKHTTNHNIHTTDGIASFPLVSTRAERLRAIYRREIAVSLLTWSDRSCSPSSWNGLLTYSQGIFIQPRYFSYSQGIFLKAKVFFLYPRYFSFHCTFTSLGHSPNLPYSKGMGSNAAAIRFMKVV